MVTLGMVYGIVLPTLDIFLAILATGGGAVEVEATGYDHGICSPVASDI